MDLSVTVKFCMTANVPKNHRYTYIAIRKCLIVIPPWDTNTQLWIRTNGSHFIRASVSKELIAYTCQSSLVNQSDNFRC